MSQELRQAVAADPNKKHIKMIMYIIQSDACRDLANETNTNPAVKYLTVKMDSKVSFDEQSRRTADKAARIVASLGKLIGDVCGPGSNRFRQQTHAL